MQRRSQDLICGREYWLHI